MQDPLTKRQKLSCDDLADMPLIVREGRGSTHKMLALLRSRGVKLNIALRCASPDALKAAVRKKMGVGILFCNLIEEDVRRKDLKLLRFAGLPRIIGNSYIVYNKNKALNAHTTEFLSLLRDMKSRQRTPVNLRKLTGTDLS